MSVETAMMKIQIDGKYYEVKPKKNLLETCLSLGLDIPHFCFHPALGSVGACRLCAVKKFRDSDDKKGRIVMSCMEPVADGLIISIEDEDAKAFRAAVIEGMMTNHPHDCPVCDEGGECHLQDMTVMTGHNYRRFDFKKRTYNNQNLGPFISHEMNRCIQCYRCVRFYRDYAGGKDLNAFSSRDHVYFGRHEDGVLENEFSGNLVEVCPTGVFTDKTLKSHFTRKWDLSNAPSVCVHCSVGCNTIISERYDSLRRVMSRYNGAVNGYFICDRGRFGYEFVNDQKRIRKSKIRYACSADLVEVENEILLPALSESFSQNKKIIGIGSARASVESNYALSLLVGKENFYHGISKKEFTLTRTVLEYLQNSGVQTASLKQIEKSDAILILGEDLINTAPMIALSLRQAIRNVTNEAATQKGIPLWNDAPLRELAQDEKCPLYIATPFSDSLDELSEDAFRASYADIATFGFAIASAISDKAPIVKLKNKSQREKADKIALSLKTALSPLIILGITSGDEKVVQAALNVATALFSVGSKVLVSVVFPQCNSMGLALIPGKSLDEAISRSENEDIDTLVVLENDLYREATQTSVDHLFEKSKQIIVIDHLLNSTTSRADILLPGATFAESEGTLVNNEGRAQRFYKAIVNKEDVQESWKWIAEIIKIKNQDTAVPWNRLDDLISSLVNELPVFSKLIQYMRNADFRMLNAKIPRQTMRYSGRTAMKANVEVSESRISLDPDSPLTFSMEGQAERPPSSLVPFYWSSGWNSVQSMYHYLDEPNGSMKGGDPGVRLIEQAQKQIKSYFNDRDQNVEGSKGELLIVPVYQIFGGDELSSVGTAIKQRIRNPFVYLNQKDAENLNVSVGDMILMEISKSKLKLNVIIENSLPSGIAAVSVKLPAMPFVDLPGFGKIVKL
jgi:NADH-quinone oxidoreductase subunit G